MAVRLIKSGIDGVLTRLGYRLERRRRDGELIFPPDLEPETRALIAAAAPFTMTSVERLYGLLTGIDHIIDHRIDGDIVECGVWRGGSMMLAARRLVERGDTGRRLWLYDTFAGMPAPSEHDVARDGRPAVETFAERAIDRQSSHWCRSPLDEVRVNLATTGYPEARVTFVGGLVEETIPASAPARIALLRLDTDWYNSTRHELEHLYPRLAVGGVLIIDDYGHWEGCRRAVDEYFAERPAPLLCRLDYTGRIGVKPPGPVA